MDKLINNLLTAILAQFILLLFPYVIISLLTTFNIMEWTIKNFTIIGVYYFYLSTRMSFKYLNLKDKIKNEQ